MNQTFYIHTFGCQMNKHDSEKIGGYLQKYGLDPVSDAAAAGTILVNTCYVREKAMAKVYSYLGRLKNLKKSNPELVIGVCGCGAQGDGKHLIRRMPWIDFVAGPQEIAAIPELIHNIRTGQSHLAALDMPDQQLVNIPEEPIIRDHPIKAWVTIMEGCNNYCSYCVVPAVRGRERSRSATDILAELQSLAAQNYKEVTLLGQNVNSYRDSGPDGLDFPELLQLLARETGITRIRFVTSHPKDLDRRVLETIATHKNLCNHLHLPVQSGSDSILQAMNRKYTVDYYRNLIETARTILPEKSLSTDVIVGFPGETVVDFQRTQELMSWIEYDTAFIYHYQIRPGTAAAKLPDTVSLKEKLRRLNLLLELQNSISTKHQNARLGKEEEILVEGSSKYGANQMTGRTTSNKIVHYPGSDQDLGIIITVRIDQVFAHSVRGTKLATS